MRAERYLYGAVIGVLSAGVALGVGEIVAAFVRPEASPVIEVGNRFVALTPESVKRWAIREFGTNDKNVLLTGIYIAIGIFAIIIGILALRRLWYGLAGIAILGGIGCYAALTTAAHQTKDIIPPIFGALAAAVVMTALVRAATTVDDVRPDRRRFLQAGLVAAAVAVGSGVLGRFAQHKLFSVSASRAAVTLPHAQPEPLPRGTDFGNSGVPWQTPNPHFYRVDTALTVPQLATKNWRLRIHGLVDREITLDFQQLLARPFIERWITLNCVSNPVGGPLISNALFLGTRLADLLREAGIHDTSDQLFMTSTDGMTIGAPTKVIMDGRDALIAIGMNGAPLPLEHGFPARIIVPGLYGYVSACKWVVDIEATTFASKAAYWVRGGWAQQTDIKLESRIDTPKNGASIPVGQSVVIAGIAWDQHVGVSKVEVQVGDSGWAPAQLATVPSTDTWRQWLYHFTAPKPGDYVVKVRATDGHGQLQTSAVEDVYPMGATGLHSILLRARGG